MSLHNGEALGARRGSRARQRLARREIVTPDQLPEDVTSMLNRLAELEVAEWLQMGRVALANGALESKQLLLQKDCIESRLALAEWYIRDAVTSLAIRASQRRLRLTHADQRLLAAAHTFALNGSMTLLMRKPHSDFQLALMSTAGSRSVKTLPPPSRGA